MSKNRNGKLDIRQTFIHALTAVLHTSLGLVRIYRRHKQTVRKLHFLHRIALRERERERERERDCCISYFVKTLSHWKTLQL